MSYDLTENVTLSGNVDNFFDKQPQMFSVAQVLGQLNTDGSTVDQLGRSFRIGLTWRN